MCQDWSVTPGEAPPAVVSETGSGKELRRREWWNECGHGRPDCLQEYPPLRSTSPRPAPPRSWSRQSPPLPGPASPTQLVATLRGTWRGPLGLRDFAAPRAASGERLTGLLATLTRPAAEQLPRVYSGRRRRQHSTLTFVFKHGSHLAYDFAICTLLKEECPLPSPRQHCTLPRTLAASGPPYRGRRARRSLGRLVSFWGCRDARAETAGRGVRPHFAGLVGC
ncbi:hypothetical protein O3P69_000197 [Scylla paramamosain]|uniref:Uncharacterized protein n=1 Tax=Scylla paramamosain TaxID=85552 RepID=A0AAW0UV96_SCYPA